MRMFTVASASAVAVLVAMVTWFVWHEGFAAGEIAKVTVEPVLPGHVDPPSAQESPPQPIAPRASKGRIAVPQAAAASTPQVPRAPDQELADRLASEKLYRARLGDRLSREVTDPAWSESARTGLLEEWQRKLPAGGHVQGVDCRSSMCRAESVLPDTDSYFGYAQAVLERNDAWIGGKVVMREEDQYTHEVHVIAFFARGQKPLPSEEELSAAQ